MILTSFTASIKNYDLQSVLGKMSHEGASQKSLSFHSAMLDSQLRMNEQEPTLLEVARTTAFTLSAANMQGISEAVKQQYEGFQKSSGAEERHSLAKWDLLSPVNSSPFSAALLTLFRSMQHTSSKSSVAQKLDVQLLEIGDALKVDMPDRKHAGRIYSSLAVLAEARQIVGATSSEGLESVCAMILARNQKLKLAK